MTNSLTFSGLGFIEIISKIEYNGLSKKAYLLMKKKSKTALNAPDIDRVKELFPKGKELFHSKESPLPFSHECNLVKLPRVAISIDFLDIETKKPATKVKGKLKNPSQLSEKQLSEDARNAHKCCANQKDFLVLPDDTVGVGLNPERVRSWKLKEYLLASRKLKKMHKTQAHAEKAHEVTLIEKPSEIDTEKEKVEQWQELLKMHEERHFQLTRITKFLID
jgi:hypothetical protein